MTPDGPHRSREPSTDLRDQFSIASSLDGRAPASRSGLAERLFSFAMEISNYYWLNIHAVDKYRRGGSRLSTGRCTQVDGKPEHERSRKTKYQPTNPHLDDVRSNDVVYHKEKNVMNPVIKGHRGAIAISECSRGLEQTHNHDGDSGGNSKTFTQISTNHCPAVQVCPGPGAPMHRTMLRPRNVGKDC